MTGLPMLLAAVALILAGSLAWAQDEVDDGHEGHATDGGDGGHAMPVAGDPAMQALMEPMDRMMQAMPATSTGYLDADFVLMMIPHHQGAIDMALVVLEQGDDEETLALAREIIAAQESEIAEMRAMLERLGVEPPAASE